MHVHFNFDTWFKMIFLEIIGQGIIFLKWNVKRPRFHYLIHWAQKQTYGG
jgi:hypothetical protein